METNKEPVKIAFSSQKGGVGKTTFTILFANYLHNIKDYKVLVVDCDFPQYSISATRKREIEKIDTNEKLKLLAYNYFKRSGKKAFNIINSSPETAMETLSNHISQTDNHYDIIFFDLPGTVNSTGVISSLSEMDYVFTPIAADRIELESSLAFSLTFKEKLVNNDNYRVKDIFLFWNQVDKREKTNIYMEYEAIIKKLKIQLLDISIPRSTRFKKELEKDSNIIFRSTLIPPDTRALKSVNIDVLADEILKILNL